MRCKEKVMVPVIWYKKMYVERKKTTIALTALSIVAIIMLSSLNYLKNKAYEGNIKSQLDAGIASGKILSYKDVGCHTNLSGKTTCDIDLFKTNSTNAQTQINQVLSIDTISIVNVESAAIIPVIIKGDFEAGKTDNLDGSVILKNIQVNGTRILWNKQNEQNIIDTYGEESSKELRKYLKESFNEDSNLVIDYKSQISDSKNLLLKVSVKAEIGKQYAIGLKTNVKLDKDFSKKVKVLQDSNDFEEITKAKMDLLQQTTVTAIGFNLFTKNDAFFKELIFKVYEANLKNKPENALQLTTELAGEEIAKKFKVLNKEQFEKIALPYMGTYMKTSLSESVIVQNMKKEGQESLNKKVDDLVAGKSTSFEIDIINKKQLSMGEIPQKVMMGYISKDPAVFINLFDITIK